MLNQYEYIENEIVFSLTRLLSVLYLGNFLNRKHQNGFSRLLTQQLLFQQGK